MSLIEGLVLTRRKELVCTLIAWLKFALRGLEGKQTMPDASLCIGELVFDVLTLLIIILY
jgi:hypothetical protein